jgi:Ca-activated chloride channel family protein
VQSLTTGRRTAIGNGILKSIDAIAEVDESVAPSVSASGPAVEVTPVPEGVYVPNIIVLLTDGANNSGAQPVDAAQQAADRGIRVYTIGFGTARGGEPVCAPQFVGGEPSDGGFGFGGGFGGFGGFRRGIDEETLKEVSALTGGDYYSAESAAELETVFRELPTSLITRNETTEVSVAFAALAALAAALALGLSQLWHPLP